jgi:hypothetical protein
MERREESEMERERNIRDRDPIHQTDNGVKNVKGTSDAPPDPPPPRQQPGMGMEWTVEWTHGHMMVST